MAADAQLEDDAPRPDEEWIEVRGKATAPAPSPEPSLTKAQRKNLNRKLARQRSRSEGSTGLDTPAADADRALALALERSTTSDAADDSAAMRRARSLRKSLRGIDALVESASAPGAEPLDDAQRARIARRDAIADELATIESELAAAAAAAEAERAARSARDAKIREEEFGVRFDERFACPICSEPLEAATEIEACKHVFCRKCLEDTFAAAAARGAPPSCPLCRASAVTKGKGGAVVVATAPARELKRRMARKETATCHCGATMALSQLREHLRGCGEGAAHRAARPRFGHEFRQPPPTPPTRGGGGGGGTGRGSRRGAPSGYDEDAELQAAIIASMASFEEAVAGTSSPPRPPAEGDGASSTSVSTTAAMAAAH